MGKDEQLELFKVKVEEATILRTGSRALIALKDGVDEKNLKYVKAQLDEMFPGISWVVVCNATVVGID